MGLLLFRRGSIRGVGRLEVGFFLIYDRLTRLDFFGTWDCIQGSIRFLYDQTLEHSFQVKEILDLRIIFEYLPASDVIGDKGPVSHLDLILIAWMDGSFERHRRCRQRICNSVLQSRDERELA